jgi:hypothetical protein
MALKGFGYHVIRWLLPSVGTLQTITFSILRIQANCLLLEALQEIRAFVNSSLVTYHYYTGAM